MATQTTMEAFACGFSCARSMSWKRWEPRLEYRKSLSIQNVSTHVQVLRWMQPDCPNFTTEYEGPVRLNPGVSCVIGLVFKPTEAVDYETQLRFTATKGSFSVILKASVADSAGHLQCRENLAFGLCVVGETAKKYFVLSNVGDNATTYEWIVDLPFFITPKAGSLQAGESVTALCCFVPEKARYYSVQAHCKSNDNETRAMMVNGTGKFIFLQLSPSILDFGDVVMGSAKEMNFNIVNTSEVSGNVCIDVLDDCLDLSRSVFKVEFSESSIEPKGRLSVKVLYCPNSSGTFSSCEISVTASRGHVHKLSCTGNAVCPVVTISKRAIDFGSLPIGRSAVNFVSVRNLSKVYTSFQIMFAGSGVFSVHPEKGVIAPQSVVSIKVYFEPRAATNYYKRVFCIIQDSHPLYCDIIGTCFLDNVDFPTLRLSCLAKHRNATKSEVKIQTAFVRAEASNSLPIECVLNVTKDVNVICQEDPKTQLPRSSSSMDESSSLSTLDIFKRINSPIFTLDRLVEQDCSTDHIWEECFFGKTLQFNSVEISPTFIEFGTALHQQTQEKIVTVRNDSEVPVFCLCSVGELPGYRKVDSMDATTVRSVVRSKGPWTTKGPNQVFSISPSHAEIAPKATVTFHVFFKPDKENQRYIDTIDLAISHSNKPGLCLIPPYSSSIHVSGNAYTSKSDVVPSEVYFFPSKINFPPVLPGYQVFQTVALRNQSCTPLRFSFARECLDKEFTVMPLQGEIEKRSFQLISIMFKASKPGSYVLKLPCSLNGTQYEWIQLTLMAKSAYPEVELVNKIVHFKPANIGVPTEKSICMKNLSDVAGFFTWDILPAFSEVFSIKPRQGVIRGKQSLQLCCSFCPLSSSCFMAETVCNITTVIENYTYDNQEGIAVKLIPGPETQKLSVTFQGRGVKCSFKIEPHKLKLGTILVGFPHHHKLDLCNTTEGPLRYVMDLIPLEGTVGEDYSLNFDSSEGIISSYSSKDIHVTFKPKTASNFSIGITCNVNCSEEMDTGRLPDCILSATALYPSLSVCGVRSEDLSQRQAWRELNLDELNFMLTELEAKTDFGLNSACHDLFGLGGKPFQLLDCPFNIIFGRGNLTAKPCTYELAIRTCSDLPVSWKIRLWNDKDVDLENWIDEPEPINEDEQLYLSIREQELISVSPREGYLNPNTVGHIKFTYKHSVEGSHSLPAILQFEHGHALPLMLCGETLAKETRILTLESNTFMLRPVAIGSVNPPLQTFELRNDGIAELKYDVDIVPLKHLQEANYGFEVLSCLNPTGTIPPRETLLLNWHFRPIEAKSYTVEVYISVMHGEGAMLYIEGSGTHKEADSIQKEREEYMQENEMILPVPLSAYRWSNMPAMLIPQHLEYEDIPIMSSREMLVAIKNVSNDCAVRYSWRCCYAAEKSVHGRFTITPSEGLIEHGRSCVCKVTFAAGIQPQIFEATLYCHVREVMLQKLCDGEDTVPSRGKHDEKVLADISENVVLSCKDRSQIEYRQSAIGKLTYSIKERLPRLAAKGPLRFPSTAAVELPSNHQHKMKRAPGIERTLFLSVSAHVTPGDGCTDGLAILGATMPNVDDCDAADCLMMTTLFSEAMQELIGTKSLVSHLCGSEVLFFEQSTTRVSCTTDDQQSMEQNWARASNTTDDQQSMERSTTRVSNIGDQQSVEQSWIRAANTSEDRQPIERSTRRISTSSDDQQSVEQSWTRVSNVRDDQQSIEQSTRVSNTSDDQQSMGLIAEHAHGDTISFSLCNRSMPWIKMQHISLFVNVFEFSKSMLEIMLFDIIKELYDIDAPNV